MARYQLIPDSVPLLLALAAPIDREAAIDTIVREHGISIERLQEFFDALVRSGIVEKLDQSTKQPLSYSKTFSNILSHTAMLEDTVRCCAFQHAIGKAVHPGDVVVDIGAGSGILSLIAARAGARKVYGLEMTRVIEDAVKVAKENGLSEKIEFVAADAANFSSKEPINVIVGEWAGMYLLDEWRHFEAFAQVRDRCLGPQGRVIPRAARLFLAPVDDYNLYVKHGPGLWERNILGFDFRSVVEQYFKRLRVTYVLGHRHCLMTEPWKILEVDCSNANSSAFTFSSDATFKLQRPGTVHGLIGWFHLDLDEGIVIDTSPFSAQTHWQQTYFAVRQFCVEADDILKLSVCSFKESAQDAFVLKIGLELVRNGTRLHAASYEYPLINGF